MFTDVVGSTSATARSERDGLALRDRHRRLVQHRVSRYGGRVVESPGDETLSVFESALGAVNAALAIQDAVREPPDLRLTIGLHLGETVLRGREVFGDAVNLAARIRSLAGPGEILASAELVHAIRGQPHVTSEPRGEHELKNVGRPVAVFALSGTATDAMPRGRRRSRMSMVAASIVAAALAAAATAWRLHESEYFWRNPLDGARIERLTDFPGDEFDAAISPDGRFTAFLSDRDGQSDVWIGQVGSGEFVNLTKGRFPSFGLLDGTIRRVGFSSDGSEVWITEGPPYVIWKVPTLGGTLNRFLPGGMEPVWSLDGKRIAYHTADPGDPIFVADASGSNARQLFSEAPGGHCHFLTWSLDGRFLYFVRGTPTTSETDIWRIPVAEGEEPARPERITRHDARVVHLSWLDARTLAYSATAEDGSGVWLYAIDVERRRPHRISGGIAEQYLSVAAAAGSSRRLVATLAIPSVALWSVPLSDRLQTEADVSPVAVGSARATSPAFTTDGLLFLSSRGGADGVWKQGGSIARELFRAGDGAVVAPPAVSKDSRRIALSVRSRGRTSLRLIDADGTGVRTLAESLDVRGAAAWSPDGGSLAVAARQGGHTQLFKVPVTGGAPSVLVATPSYHPLWSPDGRSILYSEPLRGADLGLRAVGPDGAAQPLPEIRVFYRGGIPYRFTRDGRALIHLEFVQERMNLVRTDLATGVRRQLTDFRSGSLIGSFDITPDGRRIVFDRQRENADIVLMDLAESP
jgi:Tol biopolymer transport system component